MSAPLYDEEKATMPPPQQPMSQAPAPSQQAPYTYNQHAPIGDNELPPGVKPYEELDCWEKTGLWLAVIFIAPLAIYMRRGSTAKEFNTSLILWICLGICAAFHAAYVVTKYP